MASTSAVHLAPAAIALSPQAAAVLPPFLCTMRAVHRLWCSISDLFMIYQQPKSYASGTFLFIVFDSPCLRTAAYVTCVTRRALDWVREYHGLFESYQRWKATLLGEFAADSTFEEQLRDIRTATSLFFEQIVLFIAASLNLVDILSISGQEATRQAFCHAEHLVNSYSSNPIDWVNEVRSNLPLIRLLAPYFSIEIDPDEMVKGMEQNLPGQIRFNRRDYFKELGDLIMRISDAFYTEVRTPYFPHHHRRTRDGTFRNQLV